MRELEIATIRSLLFVPGDSPGKLASAGASAADAVIVDWEDGVPARNKEFAREITLKALPALREQKRAVFVRVNEVGHETTLADCQALRECEVDGVAIPKCGSDLYIADLLEDLPDIPAILPFIETAQGLHYAAQIASYSKRVRALMFGAEDYTANTRIRRGDDELELLFARSSIVNSARAMRRAVFDSPPMQYRDLDAVRRAARRGRRLGFTGQAAIHPGQLEIINETYLPSQRELDDANEVTGRFRDHGGGVYGVNGRLEDEPAVRRALNVIMAGVAFKRAGVQGALGSDSEDAGHPDGSQEAEQD